MVGQSKGNSKDIETTAVVVSETTTPVRTGFFDSTPAEQVRQATEIANVLSSVIEKQGLFSNISGKKYIKAEGWQTLGTFLGVVPREKSVIRHDDGSYEAYIEIVKFRDGTVVGGGSAICSRKEKRWSAADEYAIRSMAITRATGKAFRVGFSWIVTLAGYSPTPEEEIPVPDKTEVQTKKEPIVYTGTQEESEALAKWLEETHPHVPAADYGRIHLAMINQPKRHITKILKEYSQKDA